MVVIAIESPPGGGKGFLLKHLAQHRLGDVPLSVALQDDSIDHVMDFINDPARWILAKELHFLWSHVSAILKQAKAGEYLFIEGSPYSDFMCYFKPHPKHPLEERLYKGWYDFMSKFWTVDMHILLVASPHEHLERIIGNSKKEQGNTTILSLFTHSCIYKMNLGHAQLLVCHPNFEDNEPAMEIMRKQLKDIVQNLKNNSLHRNNLECLQNESIMFSPTTLFS